jgi:hypothetical protein
MKMKMMMDVDVYDRIFYDTRTCLSTWVLLSLGDHGLLGIWVLMISGNSSCALMNVEFRTVELGYWIRICIESQGGILGMYVSTSQSAPLFNS